MDSENVKHSNPKGLFPSADIVTHAVGHSNSGSDNLLWLKNSSFDPKLLKPAEGKISKNESSSGEKEEEFSVDKEDSLSSEDEYPSIKHKKRKSKKSKHKKKKHIKSRSRSRSPVELKRDIRTLEEPAGLRGLVFLEEVPGLQAKNAYRVDRNMDAQILAKGFISDKYLARYHKPVNVCLSDSNGDTLYVAKKQKNRQKYSSRYFDKDNRKVLKAPSQLCRVEFKRENKNTEEFIEVFPESSPPESSWVATNARDKILDPGTKAYIEGKGYGSKDTEASQGFPSQMKSEIFIKSEEYNRKLRENPRNEELWIEFVDYQDRFLHEDLMALTTGNTSNVSKVPKKMIEEKKMMIMKKALDANPTSVKLKKKYLDLFHDSMNLEDLNTEFENLLFTYPTDTEIWRKYLLSHQCRLSTFSVSSIMKLYHKCFSTLTGYVLGKQHCHGNISGLDEQMLSLFVQYCTFLREAGHCEKAVTSFQALVEFNLFSPKNLNEVDHQDKCSVFESFWDSNAPRIGENGCRGWNHWHQKKEYQSIVTDPENRAILEEKEQEILSSEKEKWEKWMEIESLRDSEHWLPWKPDISQGQTEDDCEDLERLVLFDDILPVLIPISKKLQYHLILNFFIFLYIPIKHQSTALSMAFSQVCAPSVQHELAEDQVQDMTDLMDFQTWKFSYKKEIFVDQIVQCVLSNVDDFGKTLLTEIMINCHMIKSSGAKNKIKELKRFAKGVLKESHNRSNPLIWSVYARKMWKTGSITEAKEITEMALNMFTSSGSAIDSNTFGICSLYLLYFEMLLDFDADRVSFSRKTAAPDEDKLMLVQSCIICWLEKMPFSNRLKVSVSSTNVLKTKNTLIQQVKKHLENVVASEESFQCSSLYSTQYFCDMTMCYCLFMWCSTKNIQECITFLDTYLNSLSHHAFSLVEQLYQIKISLICYHMQVLNCPLSYLKETLKQALQHSPASKFFLTHFIHCELQSNFTGKLDRYLYHLVKLYPSPTVVIMAVISQILRMMKLKSSDTELPIPMSSIVNKMKSYLELGIQHESVRTCPFVWSVYLSILKTFGNAEKSEGVYFQALQACPWSKMLHIQGLSVLGAKKLEEVCDLLIEKELRLQLPIEELELLLNSEKM